LALSELDVTRDVMDFRFVLRSDIDIEHLSYNLEIISWTEDGIEVFANFSDPLVISQGLENDVVEIQIKNRYLFSSNFTGDVIKEEDIQISLLAQIPK